MAQYLTSWLESKRPPEIRQSTWEGYERSIRVHITPVIGQVKLSQLTAQHVQQVTGRMLARGLTATTATHAYGVLRGALKAAVRLGLLSRNVSDQTDRPRRSTREMRPLSRDEAQRFAASVQGHWLAPLFRLALSTGMRRGELLGLRWREVDLEAGRLSVVASVHWRGGEPVYTEPKSRRSRRQIALTAQMVETLCEHRHAQRLTRIAAGPAWQGERYDAVFTDALGFPLQEPRIRHQFRRALADAGLPVIRFHDLRHTCATLLLKQRVNPKIVSELLGHSTVSITLDIYSHVLPDMQEEAARAIGASLRWRGHLETVGDEF